MASKRGYKIVEDVTGVFLGLSILFGFPATIIAWIWTGEWRPLVTLAVICVPMMLAYSMAQDRLKQPDSQ